MLLEAPTGFGKSAVAIALALSLGSSYICTSTKDLQTQYSKDFPYIKAAKGKNNFPCLLKQDFVDNGTYQCGICASSNPNECYHTTVEYGHCMTNESFKEDGCKYGARLAIGKFGFGFVTTSTWDPVAEQFGAFPLIFGTLVSSLVALVIAVPLSLGVAIYLTEFAPKAVRQPVAFLISLLAAIPSVVYGLWGIFVLIPLLRKTRLSVPPRRLRLPAAVPGPDLRPVDARGRRSSSRSWSCRT